MIPIRNFPYTDYHDLNLDWLLRQLQLWEVDLEELKRRVKALEDWRTDTVDPDLRDIKLTIIDIQGDIRNLGDRLTIVEGDIVTIKGNITTLANNSITYTVGDYLTDFHLYKGYNNSGVPGEEVTDLWAFFTDLISTRESTLGIKNIAFINSNGTKSYDYQVLNVSEHNMMVVFTSEYYNSTNNYNVTNGCSFWINDQNVISNYQRFIKYCAIVHHISQINISIASTFIVNDDPDTSSDYPYYVRINNSFVTEDSIVEAYFKTLKANLTYSELVSDFIRTNNGSYDIFLTRQLTGVEYINLECTVME